MYKIQIQFEDGLYTAYLARHHELRDTEAVVEAEKKAEVVDQRNPNNTINTELVYALEKLVDLKKQGFLTLEEFTKAKENLISSLFEKSKK